MHPGDRVTADRVSSALQRIRKKYLKQNRLLAQVSIASRIYRPDTNKLDFTFLIDPGPRRHRGRRLQNPPICSAQARSRL